MKNSAKMMLLAVLVLLTGCEKSLVSEEGAASKKSEANVVLQLSVFEQLPFETRSPQDVTQLCNRLNVAFFQDGQKVKSVSQKVGDDSFGTVAVALEAGVYQLVVIGHSCDGSATITSVDKVTFPNNVVCEIRNSTFSIVNSTVEVIKRLPKSGYERIERAKLGIGG